MEQILSEENVMILNNRNDMLAVLVEATALAYI